MTYRVLIIEHEADAGLGFFGEWLTEAGITPEVVRPSRGEELPDGPLPHGLIVLGGAPSAWDDEGHPWLPAIRDLIRRSVEASVPTLGICLGAQLMTLALGGRVERGAAGLEIGLCRIAPLPAAADDPLMGRLPAGPKVVHYHQDAMTALPEGAVPLATGDPYPNQAYRFGERAWAVQFHPEASPEVFSDWMTVTGATLTAAGHDPRALDTEVAAAGAELSATWRPFAEAFAAVVRAWPPNSPERRETVRNR
ncbi:glutamine amidotransferase [Sphaerisporangium siamense]|uniref:GMP synthase-like glutamine amidotransferase n=1 Tax=Sphaerisporangium siamense TaxID=795645 RepID=A0A7W7DFC9_9ACTN|nr:type 1 glutamine amidotransferase [Sphaerisporangium siamense]MBB4704990.1 GMP synthase-like glutamine amidotransferase [Sphaerisporangium siamense]GII83795.1 glutamine amidotransferase [Sphaerisporangium siamense]